MQSRLLTPVVRGKLSSSILANNIPLPEMDPMPFGFEFMVQHTATYLNVHQVELIFALLREQVDPISIPGYVRKKCSGVDLTVEDVEAVRDGNFHVSGHWFHVRMSTSGNLMTSDAVDEFFRLLPFVSSLAEIRPRLEEEYGCVIDDADLLDLFDGAFHIVGPRTIEMMTTKNVFVPKSYSSEALWMFEQGCSSEFISAYIWYKFHAYIPAVEVIRLALNADEDVDQVMHPTLKSAPWTTASKSNCMKRTSRRAPPPPPIITAWPLPKKIKDAEAVRFGYERYTTGSAFSFSYDHADNYQAISVEEPESNSDSDYSIDSGDSSHVVVHRKDGEFIIDLDQPDMIHMLVTECFSPCDDPMDDGLPELPDSGWMAVNILSPTSPDLKFMASTDQSGLPSLRGLEEKNSLFTIGSESSGMTSDEEDRFLNELNPNRSTNSFDYMEEIEEDKWLSQLNPNRPINSFDNIEGISPSVGTTNGENLVLNELNQVLTENPLEQEEHKKLVQELESLPSLGPTTLDGFDWKIDLELPSLSSGDDTFYSMPSSPVDKDIEMETCETVPPVINTDHTDCLDLTDRIDIPAPENGSGSQDVGRRRKKSKFLQLSNCARGVM